MYEARSMGGDPGGRNLRDADYVGALMNKWAPYVDLLPEQRNEADLRRPTTAMLLENSYQDMMRMGRQRNSMHLSEAEATATSAIADYTQTIFPVLMRVFPNLIAHDLVSIQPMSGPVGAVFYFEYKHGTAKGRVNVDDNLIETFDEHYSSEFVDNELLVVGNGTDYGGGGAALAATLAFTPVLPLNSSVSDPNVRVVIREIDAATGATVQEAVDDGAGGFTGDTSAGAIDYATGAITGFLFTNPAANGNDVAAFYFYNSEGNTQVPKVTLDISLNEIRAKSRKLNVVWSAEAADDLRALHGIEGEAQLLAGVSNEIGLEIDREILRDIENNTSVNDTFDRAAAPSGIDELNYLRTLLTKITTVGAQIHKNSKRAPANWIVTSPEVAALFVQFQGHGDFIPAAPTEERPSSYGNLTSDFGIFKYGNLMNRYAVYQDPFIDADKPAGTGTILIGLKGRSYLDAGYVYSPYIPLQMTPTFLDPDDQQYKKGFRTRYAKRLLRSNFYGKITVSNL